MQSDDVKGFSYGEDAGGASEPKRKNKRATIIDVAKVSGVSRGTVSRVLNGNEYVSENAREAIEKAIIEVGYVPNTAARNLVTQRTNTVAFIVMEPHSVFLDDPNIANVLLGANEVFSNSNYQMINIIVETERDYKRVKNYLSGGFVDGVVLVSARKNDPIIKTLENLKIPSSLVCDPPEGCKIPFVTTNDYEASKKITSLIVASGRKRIAMIAAATDRASGAERLKGYRHALGKQYRTDLVVKTALYNYQNGYDACQELINKNISFDAIFAASDAIAAGAIAALNNNNIKVPKDVAIAGFDNSTWATRCSPQLSTVAQDSKTIGRTAASQVLQQLSGKNLDGASVIIDTDIILRDSF